MGSAFRGRHSGVGIQGSAFGVSIQGSAFGVDIGLFLLEVKIRVRIRVYGEDVDFFLCRSIYGLSLAFARSRVVVSVIGKIVTGGFE